MAFLTLADDILEEMKKKELFNDLAFSQHSIGVHLLLEWVNSFAYSIHLAQFLSTLSVVLSQVASDLVEMKMHMAFRQA